MRVIGFSGSFDFIDETRYAAEYWHDGAAALVEDGEVLFAIEEERLDRIKHSDKFPVLSINACLEHARIRLQDVDLFSYYWEDVDSLRKEKVLLNPYEPLESIDKAAFVRERFRRAWGKEIDQRKFQFVNHHYAHAASAFGLSGFDQALVITLDGEGDGCSGIALEAAGAEWKELRIFSVRNSLGYFYSDLIAYLGYTMFDEYKVMGLAPYGDPERFRSLFRSLYELLPNGEYEILFRNNLPWLFDKLAPRRKGEPFSQIHKDFAAGLQEALEDLAFHILTHFKQVTRQKNLCLAGGVAHNCTLNGKILRSGLFENVFIQPAAHDSGCALGAALHSCYAQGKGTRGHRRLAHVYWGADVGSSESIERSLRKWDLLEFRKETNIAESTARVLAEGSVVGWVQGRSEFGPRALGNRSILADPRPASNKDRINQLVKKREAYRPFAPSVIEEEADKFFEVRAAEQQLEFMLYVVHVKEEKRQLLGAVTHIDGTARVQTVSRKTNPRFWELIQAFGERTGVPILLNTSFNNNAEPIVESIEDAIACFLTTGLDYLVVGDYLIQKKAGHRPQDYLRLAAFLPPYANLYHKKGRSLRGKIADSFYLGVSYSKADQYGRDRHELSQKMHELLSRSNGERPVAEVLTEMGLNGANISRPFIDELIELWSLRLISLGPACELRAEG